MPLSEKLLPVVQAVLGRQVRGPWSPRFLCQLQQLWSKDRLATHGSLQEELPLELFDLLVLTLCRQAPAFATSLNYANLVMAVLTTYRSQVGAEPGTSAVRWRLGLPRTPDLAGGSGALLAGQNLAPLHPRLPQRTGAV